MRKFKHGLHPASILKNEIIPNSYNLYHTNRSDGYGGVATHWDEG